MAKGTDGTKIISTSQAASRILALSNLYEVPYVYFPGSSESKGDGDAPKLKCELCGRVDFEYTFKRSKWFCSMAFAKRYSLPVTPMNPGPIPNPSALKLSNSREDSSRFSDNSSYEEPLSPVSTSSSLSRPRQERKVEPPTLHRRDPIDMSQEFLPIDPTKWNVEDVYKFICSVPGCQEISEEFRAQEIDGQALLLLKEDHLMSAMNIKLGPALRLYARISMLSYS
ncbi:polyhomeotic-like protein 2 [Xenopus laevis]|uniref:Polyhomeotic-like protein 2 n=1 Tax=Xenopus laevis TaxID=8355 RepID=A0A8J1LCA6_XENLA|nr:polyhomeotic-like protein 2 [Xenopus laevis]